MEERSRRITLSTAGLRPPRRHPGALRAQRGEWLLALTNTQNCDAWRVHQIRCQAVRFSRITLGMVGGRSELGPIKAVRFLLLYRRSPVTCRRIRAPIGRNRRGTWSSWHGSLAIRRRTVTSRTRWRATLPPSNAPPCQSRATSGHCPRAKSPREGSA
jgi:hypothetical protein